MVLGFGELCFWFLVVFSLTDIFPQFLEPLSAFLDDLRHAFQALRDFLADYFVLVDAAVSLAQLVCHVEF